MAETKSGGPPKPSNKRKTTSKKATKPPNNNKSATKPDVNDRVDREEPNRKKRRKGSHPHQAQLAVLDDVTLSPGERADYLQKICAPRERQSSRSKAGSAPHPSKGGSAGYPVPLREILVNLYQDKKYVPPTMKRSIQRWIKDGVEPKRQTGNKRKTVMMGEHLFLLALFKLIWPQATREECACFVTLYSADGRILTNTEITKGYQRLDLTVKKGSTTAYQAFTPKNTYLHFCFWNYNFPGGIKDVPMERLMDGDEMAFHLGDASQGYGHAVRGLRVRKAGNYSRGKQKVVVIMFIEPGDPSLPPHVLGSKQRPRIWYKVTTDSGTTVEGYKSFLKDEVFPYFKDDEPERILMHDNLSSHKAGEIYDAIYDAGHRVICRPPYRPYEAPIEWVFNQLAGAVRKRWKQIKNEEDLINTIISIIEHRDGLGGFYGLFQMCGYITRMNNECNNGEGATNLCPSPTLRLDDEFVIEGYDLEAKEESCPWGGMRYDAVRFAETLSRKCSVTVRSTGAKVPFTFNWEHLGFQCGALFNSLPTRCSFLHGPLEEA